MFEIELKCGEIPHHKIGRLIWFKKLDVNHWLEDHRKGFIDVKKGTKKIMKDATNSRLDIDHVVKKQLKE